MRAEAAGVWTEAAEAVAEWYESGGPARGVDPPRNPYDIEPDPELRS